MAGLDTLPDNDLKGNEADTRDLAQQWADNLYKTAPASEADADAAELARMERNEAAGEGDRTFADASPGERKMMHDQQAAHPPLDLYEDNKSSSGGNMKAGLNGKRSGKRTASIAVTIVVAVMGGLSGLVTEGSSLLVAAEKALSNDGSDAERTNISFRRAYVAKLFCGSKCKGSQNDSKSGTDKTSTTTPENIEDKLTSMSDEQKATWEKAGFQVNLDENGQIKDMAFPDSTDVKSGGEFTNYAENTVEGRTSVSNVLDSRTAWFDNDGFTKLLKAFGIDKSKTIEPAEEADPDKQAAEEKKNFDENTGTDEKGGSDSDAIKAREDTLKKDTVGENGSKVKGLADEEGKSASEKVKAAADKAGSAGLLASPVSIACASYNVAKTTTTLIKIDWIYKLIKFAYPFVQVASLIENQGNGTTEQLQPSQVEAVANMLMSEDSNGDNAMDSPGLQRVIYGDTNKLPGDSDNKLSSDPSYSSAPFTTWGWEILANSTLDSAMKIVNTALGGKANVKAVCKGAKTVQEVAAISCLAGPWAVVGCIATSIGTNLAEKYLMPKVEEVLSKDAVAYLAKIDLTSNLKGKAVGDALASGIELLLQGQTLGSGLTPASNTTDVKNFIAATNKTDYTYTTQLAIDEAKNNQWDVTNQYSFLGQLATMLNPYHSSDGTLFSKLANFTSIVGSSFGDISSSLTANALLNQPSNMNLTSEANEVDVRTSDCQDPDVHNVGAICDWSGRIIGYTSTDVLNGLGEIATGNGGSNDILAKSIQYMKDETWDKDDADNASGGEKGVLDDNGSPKPGSPFEYYVKDCTSRAASDNKGIIPIGSTLSKATDGGYNWSTGAMCIPSNNSGALGNADQLNAYSVYYNWCYVQYATANNVSDCSQTPTTTSAAPSGSIAQVAQQMGTWGGQYQACYVTASAGNNAGHGSIDDLKQRISNHFAIVNGVNYGVDCSGFVRAVIYTATGKDPGSGGTQQMCTSSEFEHIPRAQAQPGDLAIRCDDHVEVITDVNGGNFKTVGSHTTGCGPGFGASPGTEQGNSDFVLRFKG